MIFRLNWLKLDKFDSFLSTTENVLTDFKDYIEEMLHPLFFV